MQEIYQLMHELGIRRTYQGYYHLSTAIRLVIEREERLLYIHKWLYEEVASLHHTTSACVERNIRTVKTLYWKRGDHRLLFKMAGCQINEEPSNSEFIDILSCYIKEHTQEKQVDSVAFVED